MSNQEEIFGLDYQDMHDDKALIIDSDGSSENSEISPNVIETISNNIELEEPIEVPEQDNNDNVEIEDPAKVTTHHISEIISKHVELLEEPIEKQEEQEKEQEEGIKVPEIVLETNNDLLVEDTAFKPRETVGPDDNYGWNIKEKEEEEDKKVVVEPPDVSTNELLSLIHPDSEILDKKVEVKQVVKKSLCLSDIYKKIKDFFYGVK
jgi:hypothetical protein